MRSREEFVYVGQAGEESWFQKKYYFSGGNFRYQSFHTALNLLFQECEKPLIVETGCQRLKEDVGAGMSTSIFGEYVTRYGGRVITVDIDQGALQACRECTRDYAKSITYVLSDSVKFLKSLTEGPELLYLDSYDYDIHGNVAEQRHSQEHCLNEFLAIEACLPARAAVLLDDNDFPGGGKPLLTKRHLAENGWVCLIDYQQSLWIKRS